MPKTATKRCPRCDGVFDAAAAFCQRDGTALVEEGPGEAPDPLLGRVLLEQFRIEELLGAGGMGRVYRARQTTLDRDVAVKVLHGDLVQNADAVRRFQREARIATALDHPNLVRVFLLGRLEDGSLYLVMEHLRGRPLSELLRQRGPLPPERALRIALQICEGVGEAHAHGVVHRDVKPDNVMVVEHPGGRDAVKVLDFGVARLLYDAQTVLTQSGVIFGTARYISPEGAAGEPTDARSDVYSIAVLLYQLLAGETPFDGPSPVALLMKHLHTPPPDVRAKVPAIGAPVAEVLMRGLVKDPGRRHPDARAFAAALREAAAAAGLGDVDPAAETSMPLTPTTQPARPSPAARPVASASSASCRPPPPDPRGREVSVVQVPTRNGPATLAMVLVAFLLGAGAVTIGAWLAGRLPSEPSARQPEAAVAAPAAERAPPTEAPPPEPSRPEPGVRVLPQKPKAGDSATLVGVVAEPDELREDETPRFRILRRGRTVSTVPASRDPEGQGWLASWRFRRAGEHEVLLETARGERSLAPRAQLRVTPRREPVARRRRSPADDERQPAWQRPVIAPAVEHGEHVSAPGSTGPEASEPGGADSPPTGSEGRSPEQGPSSSEGSGSADDGPGAPDPDGSTEGEAEEPTAPPAPWTGSGTLL